MQAGDERKLRRRLEFHDTAMGNRRAGPDHRRRSKRTSCRPTGFVDYKYVVLPHVFLQDTWISAAEILPTTRGSCITATWPTVTLGENFDDEQLHHRPRPRRHGDALDDGVAFRIPAGSVVGLQIHYTTTGKPEKQRHVGRLPLPARSRPKQLHHVQADDQPFAIPPGAAAHPVSASRTLPSTPAASACSPTCTCAAKT